MVPSVVLPDWDATVFGAMRWRGNGSYWAFSHVILSTITRAVALFRRTRREMILGLLK